MHAAKETNGGRFGIVRSDRRGKNREGVCAGAYFAHRARFKRAPPAARMALRSSNSAKLAEATLNGLMPTACFSMRPDVAGNRNGRLRTPGTLRTCLAF